MDSSKVALRLAGRTVVVRDVPDKAVDVLAVLKDVAAAATWLNAYASVAWGGLQFFVQAAVTHKEVADLCWDELPLAECMLCARVLLSLPRPSFLLA